MIYTLQCGTELPDVAEDFDMQLALFPTFNLMEKSDPVPLEDLQEDAFQRIIARAVHLMYKKHGIGLAAPQMRLNDRFFVWDCQYPRTGELKPHLIINPEIEKNMESLQSCTEGCLSIGLDWTVEIDRAASAKLKGLNFKNEPVEYEAEGLEAACWQHEMDHLDGILTIDYDGKLRRDLYERKLIKRARNFYHQEKNREKLATHLAKKKKRGRKKK